MVPLFIFLYNCINSTIVYLPLILFMGLILVVLLINL
uniref:Uncharacterized protein n=1 Tax=Arundo donax TaxID=35708 RepID=A0A0A9A3Y8_ARUDO